MSKSKNLNFRPAAPDELQIDLDRPRARISKQLLRLVSEHVKIKSIKYSKSKSGNTHVSIFIMAGGERFGSTPTESRNPNFGIGPVRQKSDKEPLPDGSDSHLSPLAMMEKLFLQAVLGSDPVRELLSWGRARNGCPYPTLFFEEKK